MLLVAVVVSEVMTGTGDLLLAAVTAGLLLSEEIENERIEKVFEEVEEAEVERAVATVVLSPTVERAVATVVLSPTVERAVATVVLSPTVERAVATVVLLLHPLLHLLCHFHPHSLLHLPPHPLLHLLCHFHPHSLLHLPL